MSETSRYLVVERDGKESTYDVPPKVEIRFERDHKMALSDLKKNTDLYRLAWMAAQNAGVVEGFDDWIDLVTRIDWVKGERPLAASPSSGTSLPSPSNLG